MNINADVEQTFDDAVTQQGDSYSTTVEQNGLKDDGAALFDESRSISETVS